MGLTAVPPPPPLSEDFLADIVTRSIEDLETMDGDPQDPDPEQPDLIY